VDYFVSQKEDTKLMAVTRSNLNRFSKPFHWQTHQIKLNHILCYIRTIVIAYFDHNSACILLSSRMKFSKFTVVDFVGHYVAIVFVSCITGIIE